MKTPCPPCLGEALRRVPSYSKNDFYDLGVIASGTCPFLEQLFQQPYQQRFLGMEPVFCLIPDKALASFHDFIGNFLAAVSRKTMEDPCIRRGMTHERCIYRITSKCFHTLVAFIIVAH